VNTSLKRASSSTNRIRLPVRTLRAVVVDHHSILRRRDRDGARWASGQSEGGLEEKQATPIHASAWRECLENSWTGRIARLSAARSAEKGALSPVVQAHGTTKWSLSGVSRQSLEGLFSELRPNGVLGS
jgi:hypothetical protein